jgi:hypothetical protein
METGIERLLTRAYPNVSLRATSEAIPGLDCRVAVAPRNDRIREDPRNDGKWGISCIE